MRLHTVTAHNNTCIRKKKAVEQGGTHLSISLLSISSGGKLSGRVYEDLNT